MSTASTSNLPAPTVDGGFVIATSIDIDTPKERVWAILMDFAKYPEWNPALRSLAVVGTDHKPTEDPKPVVGKHLKVGMMLPPSLDLNTKPMIAEELIIDVDHENYRFGFRSPSVSVLFRAERYIGLSEVNGKTRFEMREVAGGLMSVPFRFLFATKAQQASDEMAKALKERAEAQ